MNSVKGKYLNTFLITRVLSWVLNANYIILVFKGDRIYCKPILFASENISFEHRKYFSSFLKCLPPLFFFIVITRMVNDAKCKKKFKRKKNTHQGQTQNNAVAIESWFTEIDA